MEGSTTRSQMVKLCNFKDTMKKYQEVTIYSCVEVVVREIKRQCRILIFLLNTTQV